MLYSYFETDIFKYNYLFEYLGSMSTKDPQLSRFSIALMNKSFRTIAVRITRPDYGKHFIILT